MDEGSDRISARPQQRAVRSLSNRARGGWRTLVVVALGASALACAGPKPSPPPQAPPITGYVVGAPDQLLVHILPEPEIERTVRVRPDGKISIDLIGDVQAAGLTPIKIAESIEQRIARFKRDATVSVSVIDSPSQFVTIYGEVTTPSTFPLNSDMRVSEAIGRVGGTRPFASQNKIRIVRTNGAETKVFRVRLKDISKGDLSTNIVVEEGDLIVVPPTVLARIGYAFQMVFFPFQPILQGASTIGGVAAGTQAIKLSRGSSEGFRPAGGDGMNPDGSCEKRTRPRWPATVHSGRDRGGAEDGSGFGWEGLKRPSDPTDTRR
jgi:polysaccharide export outer membrane protein